jgi:hypothetical protein
VYRKRLAEDAPGVIEERLLGLCAPRGLDLARLPIHVLTAPSLRLDLPRDQKRLHQTLSWINPRLLVLDPFVHLHRIDENNAAEVSSVLAFLREVQREHEATDGDSPIATAPDLTSRPTEPDAIAVGAGHGHGHGHGQNADRPATHLRDHRIASAFTRARSALLQGQGFPARSARAISRPRTRACADHLRVRRSERHA